MSEYGNSRTEYEKPHHFGYRKPNRRPGLIIVPKAHCAVRLNLNNDAHIAIVAMWYCNGDLIDEIACRLGYANAMPLRAKFRSFAARHLERKYCESRTTKKSLPMAVGNYRRFAALTAAR